MAKSLAFLSAALLAALALACLPAQAQTMGSGGISAAPDYGSGASAGILSNGNFNTPESDGRPGVYFFTLGVQAFRKGDYRHAVDMYKVAASWGYKPAEYNLGVMYFKGQGVPVDRPLGAAWMVLAAERGDLQYVKARDLMVTVLSKSEFARTDDLWGDLKQTYGDQVALRRAKARWAWVRTHQTGTRTGGAVGELRVGVLDGGHAPKSLDMSGRSAHVASTASEVLQSGSIDGSVAYRQFQRSDDPYDPVFLQNRAGLVTVEPLRTAKHGKHDGKQKPAAASSSQQIPRNA